jgi:hypothetical protein
VSFSILEMIFWRNLKMSKRLTHEEFVSRVMSVHKGYIVRGQYINCNNKVQIECDKGHIWDANPKPLWNGVRCPFCTGQRAIVGETDLWTVRPDIAKLLKNPNEGYQYCRSSHHKTVFVCPDCMNENTKRIDDVCRCGFSCSFCSDGVSFPNKFGRAFLQQLPIENHICEYQPNWAIPYRYDNYFMYNGNEYILEMDGAFHYKEVDCHDRTLEQLQEIDRMKTHMAIIHGIHVVRIECIKTNCDYIKKNILLSELSDIFDLSDIDWRLCDAKAQNNLIKEACEVYMSGIHDLYGIAKMLHIHRETAYRYLKKGTQFGWCNYNPNQAKELARQKSSKRVEIVDDNGHTLAIFDSLRSCEREMKNMYDIIVFSRNIARSCKTHRPYKGFNFRFASETQQND